MSFICHIHNYTEYNQQWNVFSAFNPYKCTHTWSSGHTHTHTHTSGAVDTHTHLEQWAHTHTHTSGAVDTHTHIWSSGHTHTPGAVGTHTHTHTHIWSSGHTHTHIWSSGHTHTSGAVDTHTPGAVGSPGSSRGFGALLKGLTSAVDNSCRSRGSNPQPRVTSPMLYPLEPQLSD